MLNRFLRKLGINRIIPIIIVINIICFLLQNFDGFTELFFVAKGDYFNRPWTLLTSIFLHGSLFHILINMYILYMFGGLLESKIGSKRFLSLYLTCGIFASFISSLIYPAALGASGAIFGVIGALIILMPNLKILLMFVIPMPLWVAGILLVILDFL
ncbi:MAG: rhomboid family intramembrane serine protease, partial [Nanoarchaeota archaeon]